MDSLQTLRLWAATAWADGQLHPRESDALKRLIDASAELSTSQREEALSFLHTAPTVAVEEVQSLSAEAREGVYRAALTIVMLDGELADEEREFLARLRDALLLDEATLRRIDMEGV